MDPDVTLTDALVAAKLIQNGYRLNPDDAHRLAERVLDLDAWLRRGGFLPAAWRGTDGTTTPNLETRR